MRNLKRGWAAVLLLAAAGCNGSPAEQEEIEVRRAGLTQMPGLVLTASAPFQNTIELAWTDVSGETGYQIDRSTNGGNQFSQVKLQPANATSWTDDVSKAALTAYCYRVRPVGLGDAVSNTVCVTTPAGYETEIQTRTVSSGDTAAVVTDGPASAGKFVLASLNATGDFVEYSLNVGATGTYNVKARYKADVDRGRFQLKIDGVNQGGEVDGYAAVAAYREVSLGQVNVTAASTQKKFRFQVTGRNAASSGSRVAIDVVSLYVVGVRYEGETSAPAVSAQDNQSSVVDGAASGGKVNVATLNALNDFVRYTLAVAVPGEYRVVVRYRRGPDRGRFQAKLDGTTNLGGEINGFASTVGYVTTTLGLATITPAGNHTITFLVTGKDPASSSFGVTVDYVELAQVLTGCAGRPDGTVCDDGSVCTANEVCQAGQCVGTAVVICPPPANPCVQAFCDPRDGQCLTAAADGRACSDGNPATTGDICLEGLCRPSVDVSQRECTSDEARASLLRADPIAAATAMGLQRAARLYFKDQQADPESLAFTSVVSIPVVFHVLENPGAPAVTDQQLQNLLTITNNVYQRITPGIRSEFASIATSMPLQFELAVRSPTCGATSGIERIPTTVTQFFPGGGTCGDRPWTDPAQGGAAAWDPRKYLNVWVSVFGGNLVAGQATFPEQAGQSCDGYIIDTKRVPNDNSGVSPHEIGHYFSLLHVETPNEIQRNICAGASPTTCGTEGDLVCDTPASTYNSNSCTFTLNTCVDTPNNLPDQIENYMYSTTSPGCRSMFSAGQATRVEQIIATTRNGLAASDGNVPPPPSGTPDLWSRDGVGDTGQEPSGLAVAWASDDIWVRNDRDFNQQHEDPIYRPGNPNSVYVRVRNRGCQTSQSSTVTLKWAKASMNLGWPAPWDGTVTVDGASMGNTIGTQPVGALGPGESTILRFDWEPPNPADYVSSGLDQTHFCLLSHIGAPSTAPQDLVTLVTGSNDLVWKNVTVAAGSSANQASGMMEGDAAGNPQQLQLAEPPLPGSPGSVFNWGTVTVDLGAVLFARWVEGGSQRTGSVTVSGTSVTITGSVTLRHIMLRARERGVIRVTFNPTAAGSLPNRSVADVYRLDANQLTEGQTPPRALGGIRFLLKTRRPLVSSVPDPDEPN